MPPVDDAPSPGALEAHRDRIEKHRARREARYRSPEGWLTLVERVTLEPGENPLPPLGTLMVDAGGRVSLRVAPGTDVTRGGTPIEGEVAVAVDEPGSQPDRFEAGGRRYDVTRRAGRLSVRVRDPRAPALQAFQGIPFYPIDPAWRVLARFERFQTPEVETVGHTDGTEGETRCLGAAHFSAGGQDLTLSVYLEDSSGRLFLPFADKTSGRETYGGGRMLYADAPAAPDRPLVLDFNLAFNPPCAFNSLVSCPLPPSKNRLAVEVRAGEKVPLMDRDAAAP